MKTRILLGLLADGEIHSGESLANHLGISRTAVWKQVRRAADLGYHIETIRGRGYRLATPVDLLDRELILSGLPADLRSRLQLHVLNEVDSTNAEVIRRRPAAGPDTIPVCIADLQTAGRGRRGRVWQSPRGENLYMSLGLTFQGGFSVLDGLSLVLGVAVAEALETLGVPGVRLKWPNDIFLGGQKVGGILVELQGELEEGLVQVVAGIGLNVHMTEAPEVDQAWASLAMKASDRNWQRNVLASALIDAIVSAAEGFVLDGFGAFRDRWQRRDIFAGKALAAVHGEVAGTGEGIDGEGNYLIRSDGALKAIRAGEISLRAVS